MRLLTRVICYAYDTRTMTRTMRLTMIPTMQNDYAYHIDYIEDII